MYRFFVYSTGCVGIAPTWGLVYPQPTNTKGYRMGRTRTCKVPKRPSYQQRENVMWYWAGFPTRHTRLFRPWRYSQRTGIWQSSPGSLTMLNPGSATPPVPHNVYRTVPNILGSYISHGTLVHTRYHPMSICTVTAVLYQYQPCGFTVSLRNHVPLLLCARSGTGSGS